MNISILRVISSLILICNLLVSKAQYVPPTWAWSISGAQTGVYGYADGVRCDNAGFIYTSGRKGGALNYGGITLAAAGAAPVWNAKINSATGVATWLTHAYNSGGYDYPYGVAVDGGGNVWSTGTANSSSSPIFLTKTSAATGAVLLNLALPSNGSGRAVCADAAGNGYVTGVHSANINFGFGVLPYMGGGSDIFLAKYNAAGVCQWAVTMGGAGWEQSGGLTTDAAGNIYICGGYNGTPSFGSFVAPASGAYTNLFVAKYSSAGVCQWLYTASNSGLVVNSWWENNEIAVNGCGDAFIAGHYQGTANFGGGISLTNSGSDDAFIAKINVNGVCKWAQSMGSTGSDQGQSIAIDLDGDPYITGYYANAALLFSNAGGFTLPAGGGNNAFIAKYCGGNGALVWAQRIGGPAGTNVTGSGIAVDNNHESYINGHYSTGSAIIGTNTLVSAAGSVGNIFTTKLTAGNLYTIAPQFPTNGNYCPGMCYNITYTAAGPFGINNVFTVELSDATGSFTLPIAIGTLSTNTSGIINICIPPGTPFGNNYSLRIVSSSPSYSSKDCNITYTVGCNVLLPIELASFTAECNGYQELKWSTGTEKNNNYFDVERSENGTDFKTIGTVKAAGHSSTVKNYSFTDKETLTTVKADGNATIYYRLKQMDNNGTFTYSKIITTAPCKNNLSPSGEFNIFPNPVNSILFVNGDSDDKGTEKVLSVIDLLGKCLIKKEITELNNMPVDISNLTTGVYFVSVISSGKKIVKKFMKE